jgi:hypothetical protein
MKKEKLNFVMFGCIVVFVGIIALLTRFFNPEKVGLIFLPGLALIFIVWGILSKEEGLIVPGGILLGIGLGAISNSLIFGNDSSLARSGAFNAFFGIGWYLITLITKLFFKKNVWWPLIPGTILVVIGSLLFYGNEGLQLLSGVGRVIGIVWPFMLIGVGLLIIVKNIL